MTPAQFFNEIKELKISSWYGFKLDFLKRFSQIRNTLKDPEFHKISEDMDSKILQKSPKKHFSPKNKFLKTFLQDLQQYCFENLLNF